MIINLFSLCVAVICISAASIQAEKNQSEVFREYAVRPKLAVLIDGLFLHLEILTSSHYSEAINESNFMIDNGSIALLKSLVDLILQQRDLEKTGFFNYSKTNSVLGAVSKHIAEDACAYLSERVANWYKNFDCSMEQLKDVSNRIQLHTVFRAARIESLYYPNIGANSPIEQSCTYWNSRLAKNCTTFTGTQQDNSGSGASNVTPIQETAEDYKLLKAIQKHIVQEEVGIYCYHEYALCSLDSK